MFLLLSWPMAGPALPNDESRASLLCDLRSESLTADVVERAFEVGRVMPISSYDDDPFVHDAVVECLSDSGFAHGQDGRPLLSNTRVLMQDEGVIFRATQVTGDVGEQQDLIFLPFANNPWPAGTSNADGSFRFPDEPRFPLHEVERGPDGRPILRDGLQIWKPRDLHRGMTTAFEAANKVKDAAESWSGRRLSWGVDEILEINAHAFIDFNAFYSPSARMIFFGIVPYRLLNTTEIKMFETATSWEFAAHETGHAVHHTLKPNVDVADVGFRTWGESFADQMAMWTALRDPGRVRALLGDTHADLSASNALSRIGEVFGVLTVTDEPLREAVNDATVSTTSLEVHDRSEVLTGALYRLFVSLYDDLRHRRAERALEEAGAIMGTFLTRATDYTPENTVTLEDIGKAYLKLDKELLGGRLRPQLVDEFIRREIFNAASLSQWLAHEAAVPDLRLSPGRSVSEVDELVRRNLGPLGIGPGFGLVVQSVIRDDRLRQTIVRVQLTQGRGAGAVLLDNHGILVFRANGTLADYHSPLPPDLVAHARAVALLDQARRLGLDRHGVPLSVVRKRDGQQTVEVRVFQGDGLTVWIEAFSLDNPRGERREVVSRSWGNESQAARLQRAGIVLSGDQLSQ
jgi:hypothetical protein